MDAFEFAYIQMPTNSMKNMIQRINDLGVEGWELVSLDDHDRTIGINAVVATMKRRLVPLGPPPDEAEGWYPDPAGRFDLRHWNGNAWTFYVAKTADKSRHRDPPTMLPPSEDMVQ